MKAAQVKEAISKSYPLAMTYSKARNVRIGHGRMRRSERRTVGFSEDRILSVELIGHPGALNRLDFMLGMHNQAKAASGMMAILTAVRSVHPSWDDEQWLKEQIEKREDAQKGKLFLSFQEPMGVPILFLKVIA